MSVSVHRKNRMVAHHELVGCILVLAQSIGQPLRVDEAFAAELGP
jgi:hypothetical protein